MKTLIESRTIKCDKEDCQFSEDITNDELEKWRNKPCPVCDSNLLTDKDYNSITAFYKLIDSPIYRFFQMIFKFFGVKERKYTVSTDGTGNISLKG